MKDSALQAERSPTLPTPCHPILHPFSPTHFPQPNQCSAPFHALHASLFDVPPTSLYLHSPLPPVFFACCRRHTAVCTPCTLDFVPPLSHVRLDPAADSSDVTPQTRLWPLGRRTGLVAAAAAGHASAARASVAAARANWRMAQLVLAVDCSLRPDCQLAVAPVFASPWRLFVARRLEQAARLAPAPAHDAKITAVSFKTRRCCDGAGGAHASWAPAARLVRRRWCALDARRLSKQHRAPRHACQDFKLCCKLLCM